MNKINDELISQSNEEVTGTTNIQFKITLFSIKKKTLSRILMIFLICKVIPNKYSIINFVFTHASSRDSL